MSEALREKLINAGRVLVSEGQGDYIWGHVTVRLPDQPTRFLMKPACIGLEEMTPDNIITVDLEGEKIAGDMPRHNEVFIHSEILRARPELQSVVHTHPPHAVAFSTLGQPLKAMSNDSVVFRDGVPVFSETTDLIVDQARGKAVARCLSSHGALLLRNHGIVTAGRSIEEAVFLAIKLEKACRLQLLAAAAGGPKLLVKKEDLQPKARRTNRSDQYKNLFNYLVRRWFCAHCGGKAPAHYHATPEAVDSSGYKS